MQFAGNLRKLDVANGSINNVGAALGLPMLDQTALLGDWSIVPEDTKEVLFLMAPKVCDFSKDSDN